MLQGSKGSRQRTDTEGLKPEATKEKRLSASSAVPSPSRLAQSKVQPSSPSLKLGLASLGLQELDISNQTCFSLPLPSRGSATIHLTVCRGGRMEGEAGELLMAVVRDGSCTALVQGRVPAPFHLLHCLGLYSGQTKPGKCIR